MPTNIKPNFLILIFLFGFFGCEEETQIDIPVPKTNLVVNGILQPEKKIEIQISQSTYVLNNEINFVKDAEVRLFKEGQFLETLTYQDSGMYFSTIKPTYKTCYAVEINTPKFPPAFAEDCLPSPVKIDSITFRSNAGTDQTGMSYAEITLTFTDPPAASNYYMLHILDKSIDSRPFIGYSIQDAFFSYSPIFEDRKMTASKVFSDNLFNGNSIALPLNVLEIPDYEVIDYKLKVELYSISESFYTYYKKMKAYNIAANSIFGINNLPEIYSNVKNANGIFSSVVFADSAALFHTVPAFNKK